MDRYEMKIRLLELAQQILSENIWVERNRLEQNWMTEKEQNSNNPVTTKFPVMPVVTHYEILAVAKELEKFVGEQ